jgi:hypothetical protein
VNATGHVDHLNDAEFEESLLKGAYEPLAMGGELVAVNTADFASVDYDRLTSALTPLLTRQV